MYFSFNRQLNAITLGRKPNQQELIQKNIEENWFIEDSTPEKITNAILKGWSISGAVKSGGVGEDHIVSVSMILVDLDKHVDIETTMAHPIVKDHALMVYTTPSHTPENPRLRVVFLLDEEINTEAAKATLIALHRDLSIDITVDASCIDLGRLYYGGKEIIYRDDSKRLNSAYTKAALDNGILGEYTKDSPVSFDEDGIGYIWKVIHTELSEALTDHNVFMTLAFPDITDLEPIKPQRSNILAQYRGNPTYRESTSGKSFDISFMDDGSIIWCDKSDPSRLSGHFIDYYYRYLSKDINYAIPFADHKTFWDTLKKLYKVMGVPFRKTSYTKSKATQIPSILDAFFVEYLEKGEVKRKLSEVKSAQTFLEFNHVFYAPVNKKFYLWVGTHYQEMSADVMAHNLCKWIELVLEDTRTENNTGTPADPTNLFCRYFTPEFINKILAVIRSKTALNDEVPKHDRRYIPFANGVYDLELKLLLNPSHEMKLFFTHPFNYNPTGMALERFRGLLAALTVPDYDLEPMLRWFASTLALSGSKTKVALGLFGDSNSGKTAITDTICRMLGKTLAMSTNFHSVLGDKATYGAARLLGKGLVALTEFKSFKALSVTELSRFKDSIGADSIDLSFNIKYGDSGESEESFAVMLNSQDIPELPPEDNGILRRIVWVEFKLSDLDLKADFAVLRDNQFLGDLYSDFLNSGLGDDTGYISENYLKSSVHQQIVESLQLESEPMIELINSNLELDARSSIKSFEIFEQFEQYMIHNHDQPVTLRGKNGSFNPGMYRRLKATIKIVFPKYNLRKNYDQNNKTYRGLKLKNFLES